MSTALTHISAFPVDGPTLTEEAGTFWSQYYEDRRTTEPILERLAWSEADVFADLAQIKARWSLALSGDRSFRSRYATTATVERLRDGSRVIVDENICFVAAIVISGVGKFEYGRDYTSEKNQLIFSGSLPSGSFPVVMTGVSWVTGDLSRFWTGILGIPDDSSDTAELIRAFMRCIQNRTSEALFLDLVSHVFQCPKPTQPQTVRRVEYVYNRPIIESDVEYLVGPENSSPLVGVGDELVPGQDVFDAVRFWNATESDPPSWVSSLKVPQRYFSPIVNGDLEFSNANEPTTTTMLNGRPFVTFPVTGQPQHVDQFFNFVRQREDELNYSMLSFLTDTEAPTAGQIPAEISPLWVLRRLWLNYGATVSYVRLEPTLELLTRMQLLRRATPPWLTHIVHFEQPVPTALIPLC